jgi:hypothetical protein
MNNNIFLNYKIVSKSVHTHQNTFGYNFIVIKFLEANNAFLKQSPSPYTRGFNNIFQMINNNNNNNIESFSKTKYIKTITKNYFLTLFVTISIYYICY